MPFEFPLLFQALARASLGETKCGWAGWCVGFMSMQMSLKVGNRVKWYVHSRSLLFHIPHTHRHIWCAQCVLRSRYEDMLKCVMSYGKTLAVINWNEKKLWKSEQTHTHTHIKQMNVDGFIILPVTSYAFSLLEITVEKNEVNNSILTTLSQALLLFCHFQWLFVICKRN